MNNQTFFICLALVMCLSMATAQRNENMFSPAGCAPNSRPTDCAPKNQRTCGDIQNQDQGNDDSGEGEADCEGEGCVCFDGYVWNEDKSRCVEPSECDQGTPDNQEDQK